MNICFVCLGNIVRSPLAENLFMHLAEKRGIAHKFATDSAGTGAWHVGEPPDKRMRNVAARNGLEYDGRARQFTRHDFDRFDLIVAMDTQNREHIWRLASGSQRHKVKLLRDYDPYGSPESSVPDPYYGGMDGFEKVYSIVERSCEGLLAVLENSPDWGNHDSR